MTAVIEALANVAGKLAEQGIGKGQTNKYDNYAFRGIDDVYNAMGPLLAENKLVFAPISVKSKFTDIHSSGGKVMQHCKVKVNYSIVCPGGEQPLVVEAEGEAMDRGDKSLNKAMSSAYKNLVFQLFCIPVEGQDSEQDSPEVQDLVPLVNDEMIATMQNRYAELDRDRSIKFMEWLRSKGCEDFSQVPIKEYERVLGVLEKAYGQQYEEEQAITAQSMGEAL